MLEIFIADKQCEDRCIIGIIDIDYMGKSLLYDGNVVEEGEEGKVTTFNFCPACGQELTVMQNKTDKGMRFSKL